MGQELAGAEGGVVAASRKGAGRAVAKRGMDLCACVPLAAAMLLVGLALVVLNPVLNPGPLLFSQVRMGRHGRPFTLWKFRSMAPGPLPRGPFEPVEAHRIGRFGACLRRSRLDELPQVLNILRGEMSLVGPRPDCFEHALAYLDQVPGYRARTAVQPGLTGLAQISAGYAEDAEALEAKVAADRAYLATASLALDLRIAWRTVGVVLRMKGR